MKQEIFPSFLPDTFPLHFSSTPILQPCKQNSSTKTEISMHFSTLKLACSMLLVAAAVTSLKNSIHIRGVEDSCILDGNFIKYHSPCVPSKKPKDCSKKSWEKLKSWNSSDKLPKCPPPPKYQSIKGWEKCLRKGYDRSKNYEFDCFDVRSAKPAKCKTKAYSALKALKGKDAVKSCPYKD